MTSRLLILPLLALAACAHPQAVTPSANPALCRTETLTALIGRPGSAVLAADAMAQSGAKTIRFIKPGDAVTMDFREDRLNVRLDRNGIVEGFACG